VKVDVFRPEFVEYIPEKLEPGVLYISMKYEIANHLCACGCGQQTVMSFGSWPDSWTLTSTDQGVTFSPSIGNFQIAC